MSFKVLSEDQHSFKVRHPDGSDFLIAKAGLDDKVMKKIKGFYQGGATGAGEDTNTDPMSEDTAESQASKGWGQLGDMALAQNMRARQEFADAQSRLMAGDPSAMGALGERAAASTVRSTSGGTLLGTVPEDILESGEKNTASDLMSQARKAGIDYDPNKVKNGISGSLPNPPPPKDVPVSDQMIDRVKARYGDKISDAQWDEIGNQATASNKPYVPIKIKGQHSGFYPNFDATPTGQIGDPNDFMTTDPKKIFQNDPLNWVDNKYGATKQLLQKHMDANIPVNVTTGSDLIAHDDYMGLLPQGSSVNMVLTSPIGENEHGFSSGSPMPSNKRMLIAADKLKQSGINVKISTPTSSGKLHEFDPFSLKTLMNDYNAKYTPNEE